MNFIINLMYSVCSFGISLGKKHSSANSFYDSMNYKDLTLTTVYIVFDINKEAKNYWTEAVLQEKTTQFKVCDCLDIQGMWKVWSNNDDIVTFLGASLKT